MEDEVEAPEPVDEPLPEELEPLAVEDELLELSDDDPPLDELSEDPEDVEAPPSSAMAIPCPVAIAVPTPSATASPPTRPTVNPPPRPS